MFFVLIICLIFISSNVYALKLLEPITKNLRFTDSADLGYFSAGEFFMISFLIEDEKYHTIKINPNQLKDAVIEPTKHTPESIYSVIKLEDHLDGFYELKLILISEDKEREVKLNLNITDEVIHTNLLNYNYKVGYEKMEEINLKVINKSNTTKKINITSNLPITWFKNKKEILEKNKTIILAPNSVTEIDYHYFPKEIGFKEFNLIINLDDFKENNNIIYNLNIDVSKSLSAIYGSRNHTYPLFNINVIPIYFFNKILRII